MSISLPQLPTSAAAPERTGVLLVGNPNAGKTTLFNRLTGLRAKTANFAGTTVECRTGLARLGDREVELLDLPGLYSLSDSADEERLAHDAVHGEAPGLPRAAAVVLLVDASRLERNLFLASQVLELGVPVVVALNMVDLARRDGIHIEKKKLARELGCPVVPIVARTGRGLDQLRREIAQILNPEATAPAPQSCELGCGGCPFQARTTGPRASASA